MKGKRTVLFILVMPFALFFALIIYEYNFGKNAPNKIGLIARNLTQIGVLKSSWALEHGVTNGATLEEVGRYMASGPPMTAFEPVAGERYVINPLNKPPEAELLQAVGRLPKGTVIRLVTNGQVEIILPTNSPSR